VSGVPSPSPAPAVRAHFERCDLMGLTIKTITAQEVNSEINVIATVAMTHLIDYCEFRQSAREKAMERLEKSLAKLEILLKAKALLFKPEPVAKKPYKSTWAGGDKVG
jgi:hypothetical protein